MVLPVVEIEITADPKGAKKGLKEITAALAGTDAATAKYKKGLEELQRAEKSGLLSAEKLAKGIDQLESEYLDASMAAAKLGGGTARLVKPTTQAAKAAGGFSGAMKRMGGVSRQTRAQIQNTAFQLQDIAVQLEMGTSVSRTLSQQLPQLAGGFGAVGAVVGVLAGVGIPLLALAFSGAGDDAKTLQEIMEDLKGTTSDLNTELQLLKTGLVSAEELAVFNQIKKVEAERLETLAKISKLEGIQSATLNRRLSQQNRTIELLELELKNHQSLREEVESTKALRDDERLALEAINAKYVDVIGSEEGLGKAVMANNQLYAERLRLIAAADPLDAFGGAGRFVPKDSDPWELGGGGGGSGGGGGDGRLEGLIEQLQTEQELADQFRAEGLAALEAASAQELEVLGGINEAKLRLEQEYQDRLAGIQSIAADSHLSATIGGASSVLAALGAFNDKALKISKVAGAAEAVVNAWRAHNAVLADPTLPWFARVPTALGILASGLKAVSAINSTGSGGGGGSAGGSAGAAAAAPVASQSPLNVRLSGLGPGDSITGGQLSSLFDRLQDEAGDRGLQVSFAT